MKYLAFFIGMIISIFIGIYSSYSPSVGAQFVDGYLDSIDLAPTPSNGNCLTTDGTDNAWGSCGAGSGGATTTINGVSGPTFTFATGTATGIGLTVSTSSGTVTFTPTVSSGYGIPLTASTTEWSEFYATPSLRITAGTGIDWSGNTLNGVYTAGDALTLTGEDFDFDGGATPSGDLGGTWASPSVTDDSHAHTSTTLSGIDISSDTNLTGDTEIVLTGDALSIAASIARDSELHSAVTLSGALDYITLVGQDIVRGVVDLATDVGSTVLGIANGGLGAAFTDPNADQLMFWDDTAAKITGIVTLAGITISGTTATVDDVTCTDCLTVTEITDSYLLNNGDVGTGAYDFGGADSFEIPNGTAPTVDAIGEIALDTTDNQLIIATSTAASAPGVLPITQSLGSFLISSTSQPFSAGFVTGVAIPFKIHRDGYTVTEIHCDIDGGTSIVVNFDNGSGNTSTVTCDTDGASLIGVGSNAVVTAGSVSTAIETGTVTGSPNYLRVSVFGVYTRE